MSKRETKKILCLHGGGGSSSSLRNQSGMIDLIDTLIDYQFEFVDSPLPGGIWWEDPPDKDDPTTDPNHANTSILYLINYINDYGPFYGILGYSQGAAMALVMLAYTDIVFEKIILCNGYLPTTHQGLIDTINDYQPFSEKTAIFLATNDAFYSLGLELKDFFSNKIEIISTSAGHALPTKSDSKFNNIVNFITDGINGDYEPEPEPQPESKNKKNIIVGSVIAASIIGIALISLTLKNKN